MNILHLMRAGAILLVSLAGLLAWADDGNPPVVNSWDFETIQAAIDQAPSPSIVLLPPGDVVVDEPLRLRDGVILDGQGSTVIRPSDAEVGIPFTASPDAISEPITFTRLQANQVRLRTSGQVQVGDLVRIGLPDGDYWVSEVVSAQGASVSFADSLPSRGRLGMMEILNPIEKSGLRNLTIVDSKNPFWLSGTRNLVLDNIRIEANALYSVIDQSYRVTVRALSKFKVNAGLAVFSSNQIVVEDSLVDQHAFAGIFLRSAFNTAVQNVQIIGRPELTPDSGLTGDGITIYRGEGIRVSQVQVRDTSCYGTWITEGVDISYTDVSVNNSLTHSFYAVDSVGVSFVRCRSSLNRNGWGFVLVNNQNITLRHNLAQRVPLGFFLMGNAGGRWQRNVSHQNEFPDYFEGNLNIDGL